MKLIYFLLVMAVIFGCSTRENMPKGLLSQNRALAVARECVAKKYPNVIAYQTPSVTDEGDSWLFFFYTAGPPLPGNDAKLVRINKKTGACTAYGGE